MIFTAVIYFIFSKLHITAPNNGFISYVHFGRIHSSFDDGERISCSLSLAIMFVHYPANVKSCHSRITMTRDSYSTIKITNLFVISKEGDILLSLNQNKTLNISLSFRKERNCSI